MRRSREWCGVFVVGLLLESTPAGAQFNPQPSAAADAAPQLGHHFSVGNVPSHRAVLMPGVSQPVSVANPGTQLDRHRHVGSTSWLFWGAGYPNWWAPAFTSPFPYYSYPFPYAPTFSTVQQSSTPAARALDQLRNDAVNPPRSKSKVKATSAQAKAKAGKFIGYGDANFLKQKYLAAMERYRTAAEMAPDLAEPFFRQGYALVALGQFDNATKAFRRGLRIRSDWTDSEFRLDQIYGDDRLAKTNHLENLAKAVEANPLDSDLLIALGIQLYFDGQIDRSGLFFARAAQLGGNEDRLLNDFVPKPGPAGAAEAQRAAKVVF